MPETQAVEEVEAWQGPSPLVRPQTLLLLSQTPDWQTKVAADAVQVPFSVVEVCSRSVGMAIPLASCAVQS
jgi:hypothetical protein